MRILGISSSPRKGGNTDVLLDYALKGAKDAGTDTKKIILNDLKIAPCQECGGCDKTGVCVVKDDMQGIYKELDKADAIIVASPIFFGSLSAQAKSMIDRCQALWVAKYILKKPGSKKNRKGVFIAAGATDRKDFFDNAKSIVKNFFRTIDVEYKDELFCPNVDMKGKVQENKPCCDKAYQIGKELTS